MSTEDPTKLNITTSSGKDVKNTNMLKGEASDSLSGKNALKTYETGGPEKGKLGGLPLR